jgi:IS5 family transposase
MSFADAEYAGKLKQTRRERFLIEMDQVVPWEGLIALTSRIIRKAVSTTNSFSQEINYIRLCAIGKASLEVYGERR